MRLLFILTFLLPSSLVYSCSCYGSKAFCENIRPEVSQVVLVKKIRDVGHGMEVKVLDSFASDIEDDEILVWGDTGILCRMYTSNFENGERYVLNVHRLKEEWTATTDEKEGDFAISVCGTHALVVNGFNVEGHITDTENVESMSLTKFGRDIVNSACARALKVSVSPNPFWDEIRIQSNDDFNEIELYDIRGQYVYYEKLNSAQSSHILKLDQLDLAVGVYVLKLYATHERSVSIKLIKY